LLLKLQRFTLNRIFRKSLPFFFIVFFCPKNKDEDLITMFYKCRHFGYVKRLNEINRRVWYCLVSVATDKEIVRKVYWRFVSIDTAWIHKKAHIDAAPHGLCLHIQYFLRVDCVMSETIRQFARKSIVEQQIMKIDYSIPGWPIELLNANPFLSGKFTFQSNTGQSKRITVFVHFFSLSRLIGDN